MTQLPVGTKFVIAGTSLDPALLTREMADTACGALVTFEGWVRDNNEGKEVTELWYEAFEALCVSEAALIFAEAKERFACLEIRCVHRTGQLRPGDVAVWVGVTSRHRGPAFEACSFVIDSIKGRLPIWKKEFYRDHHSGWVNCPECERRRPDVRAQYGALLAHQTDERPSSETSVDVGS